MEPVFTYGDISLSLIELVAVVTLILLTILITLLLTRKSADLTKTHFSEMQQRQMDLQGRLSQFAEDSAQRESVLRESLDKRLDKVSETVGKSIVDTQERNSASMKHLHERLALIDRAQKNIETLSGEVSGL